MSAIKLTIACTDKDQHPWIVLGDLTLDEGLLRANIGAVYGAVADARKEECVWLDHLDPAAPEYRVHLRCPRCSPQRHVQWTHARAVLVMTQYAAAGMATLDVSAVP